MCLPGTAEAVRATQTTATRRTVLAGGGAAALAATLAPASARATSVAGPRRLRVRDLTHPFTTAFPVYTGSGASRRALKTFADDGFYSQEWTFGEHTGTHMDAPGHFVDGGRQVDQLRPAELVLPLAVVDISKRAAKDPDTEVTVDDLKRFERRHGRIPKNALVAMDSGWAAKLGTDAFLGRDASGTFHFPGFGAEAADWLLERRRVKAIGVDTLSLDPGPSTSFAVHVAWLGANRYGLENLAGLDRVPANGALATVGVIPWQEGSGGPVRVLATY